MDYLVIWFLLVSNFVFDIIYSLKEKTNRRQNFFLLLILPRLIVYVPNSPDYMQNA